MNEIYPKVSIIIPVLNRARSIDRCLRSLVELDYPSYEIIVVDNGSTDDTVAIVSRYPVKLLHEPIRGPYTARNTGARAAGGSLIFFIDSDCVAEKTILKKLVSALLKNNVAGVGGRLMSHDPESIVERFGDLAGILQYTYPRGFLPWKKNKFLSGAIFTSNALFRKEVLEELGYFDGAFRSGGDYDFCWRLQRAGYRIYFEPDAVVYHIHRTDLVGLIKQFFKFGYEQPRLLKKQPEKKSFIKIKTYFLEQYEFSAKLPLMVLVNIDALNLFPFTLLLSIFSAKLLYFSVLLLLALLLGTALETRKVVKKSGDRRWYFLYPFYHFVRNYAFTAGRIYGAFKYGVLSF